MMKYSGRLLCASDLKRRTISSKRPPVVILSTRPILLCCNVACVSCPCSSPDLNRTSPLLEQLCSGIANQGHLQQKSGGGHRIKLDDRVQNGSASSWPFLGRREPHHSVFCSSPHSLHVYATRTCPGAAKTRFGAPHFPHMASIRVLPCFTATVFRSIASFTRRSVSSRIDCFDISRFLPLLPPRSYRNQRHFSAEQVEKRRRVDSTSTSS